MPHRIHLIIAPLVALTLGACASNQPATTAEGEESPQMTPYDSRLSQYQINTWSAPDNRTLIIRSRDGSTYRARLLQECFGLRFTTSVGFITRGTSQLDRFAGIVLPDGTRCTFQSFERLPEARTAESDEEEEEAASEDAAPR